MREILAVWNCQEHREQLRKLGVPLISTNINSGGPSPVYKEPISFNQEPCPYCLLEDTKDKLAEAIKGI